ncbi:PREDICTED: interferon tau-3-like [Thamnophis sirtalis]|uniref:Interferon tau-3-like n=1 Tax=Thamnophis sirtalis TaxID=35019 RepID=A0A6I9Y602_9SAUR|nr:PREDICTED: interferon tau-3-like [Thamnophis sirtalis]
MIMNSCCLYLCIGIIFGEISCENCNQLQRKLLKANQVNFKLLSSNIKSTIPLQCYSDITDLSVEGIEKILIDMNDESQVGIAKTTIEEILQQIDLIFRQNHPKSIWHGDSLRDFHIGLDLQIKMLETCGNAKMEQVITSPRNLKLQLPRLRVKRHFQKVRDFLKKKKYSLCAWKIVQIEMKQFLERINYYIQRIPSKAIDF